MTTKRTERPSLDEFSPRRPAKAPPARRPPQEKSRPRPPTSDEVEKNLKESLTSTAEGLEKFLASLQQAGLPEAVQAYRAMQMVVLQQRLWVHGNGREQFLPEFASIAQTAGELHRIFASFADVMKPLKEVDKLSAPEITKPAAAAAEADDGA